MTLHVHANSIEKGQRGKVPVILYLKTNCGVYVTRNCILYLRGKHGKRLSDMSEQMFYERMNSLAVVLFQLHSLVGIK